MHFSMPYKYLNINCIKEHTQINILGKKLFLKRFNRFNKLSNFKREIFALKLCVKNSVKVPKIFFYLKVGKYIYLCNSFISGKCARNSQAIENAIRNYGKELKKIHNLKINYWGEPFSHPQCNSWADYINYEANKSMDILYREKVFNKEIIREIREKLNKYQEKYIYDEQPRLLHGDPNLNNFIVDSRGKIKAVVDFEYCKAGDPFYDLGMFNYFNYSYKDSLKYFLEGYYDECHFFDKFYDKIIYYSLLSSIRMSSILLTQANRADNIIHKSKKRILTFNNLL